MRKKLYKQLDRVEDLGIRICDKINREIGWADDMRELCRDKQKELETLRAAVKSLTKINEQLAQMLCDKYENGFFIFSEGDGVPTVIRNGKVLTEGKVSDIIFRWLPDKLPEIEISYEGCN